jgi:hypothetical protein
MRQIDAVHDAEHQRQAGGKQEKHQAELQAVEGLFEDELQHESMFAGLGSLGFTEQHQPLAQ